MTTRTTKKTVSFSNPFSFRNLSEVLPAGDYLVETDEDLLLGLSFSAYIRIATRIYIPGTQKNTQLKRALTITPEELEMVLVRDRKASKRFSSKNSPARSSEDFNAIDCAENEGMTDLRV
jgi:hypothetical protein